MGVLIIPACFPTHEKSPGDENAVGSSVGAGTDATAEFEHPREVYFSSDDPDYNYWEGTTGKNSCASDSDCLISGCHDSACAAEDIEIDDDEFCESREFSSWVGPGPPLGLCGCINGECQWYFENDYDRYCETDNDCDGLGFPPEGMRKAVWYCRNNGCHFGFPDGAGGAGGTGGDGGSGGGTSFLDGGVRDCSEPAEGCPCEPGTPSIPCVLDVDAGQYHEGVRSCRDGAWTECQSTADQLGNL
jgi:hypothetical protein